ncbi:MAG: hypothetical protein IKM38_10075 [Christensenellaceae bacterium]|nr:hypothetical protein [Christensenellaceae bacterium]
MENSTNTEQEPENFYTDIDDTELVHVFINDEEIVTTPSHPFYRPNHGWTDAIDLRAGDKLVAFLVIK